MMSDERIQQIEHDHGGNRRTLYNVNALGIHSRDIAAERALDEMPWLIGELRDARAEVDEAEAQVHIQHQRAIKAEAELVDARVEVERLNSDPNWVTVKVSEVASLRAERDGLRAKLAAARDLLAASSEEAEMRQIQLAAAERKLAVRDGDFACLSRQITLACEETQHAEDIAEAAERQLAAVRELIAADPDDEMVHSVAYQTARHERTGIALVAAQAVMRELRDRLAALSSGGTE